MTKGRVRLVLGTVLSLTVIGCDTATRVHTVLNADKAYQQHSLSHAVTSHSVAAHCQFLVNAKLPEDNVPGGIVDQALAKVDELIAVCTSMTQEVDRAIAAFKDPTIGDGSEARLKLSEWQFRRDAARAYLAESHAFKSFICEVAGYEEAARIAAGAAAIELSAVSEKNRPSLVLEFKSVKDLIKPTETRVRPQ